MPHPAELAVRLPDGTLMFLVYDPSPEEDPGVAPLLPKGVFRTLSTLHLEVDRAEGTPWVAGRRNERIFQKAGLYEFRLTETLETEDLPIATCRVTYVVAAP
jgi:hypothetical protein